MEFVIETGDVIDARINRRLIENLFFKNSPLHDGAMVIANDRIVAARCTLPITENPNIPAHYGMRHRAATGLSEETDASVIVVSEETGNISFVKDGKIKTMGSITELRLAIENSYKN
jgi:DNA integrity scanning protein DisA with diadenylate cyclase activity